jgi:hypothetical protein
LVERRCPECEAGPLQQRCQIRLRRILRKPGERAQWASGQGLGEEIIKWKWRAGESQ